MTIPSLTDKHLINRIAFFNRRLLEKPQPYIYAGNSDFAEDSVEQENRHNDDMAESIKSHITYMKREARKRGLAGKI